jgi:hypothetical protein
LTRVKDSLERFTAWLTYEDAKAAFARTLLAIAFSNLLDRRLVDSPPRSGSWHDTPRRRLASRGSRSSECWRSSFSGASRVVLPLAS